MTTPSMSINKQALWSERVAAWEASELSQPRFCEQNNISYSAFGYWRTRLKKQKPIEPSAEPRHFLPVNIKNHDNRSLILKINALHSIELSSGFDAALLSQIIQAIQGAA